ncbi:MAG: phage BR0599 family protein, partial [Rhodanobacter sp.]
SYTGALERRGIDEHLGKQLRLLGKSDGLLEGMDVKAYPGCQRTSAVCAAKYNNLLNYGGYPHLPGKSPFDGDPLY